MVELEELPVEEAFSEAANLQEVVAVVSLVVELLVLPQEAEASLEEELEELPAEEAYSVEVELPNHKEEGSSAEELAQVAEDYSEVEEPPNHKEVVSLEEEGLLNHKVEECLEEEVVNLKEVDSSVEVDSHQQEVVCLEVAASHKAVVFSEAVLEANLKEEVCTEVAAVVAYLEEQVPVSNNLKVVDYLEEWLLKELLHKEDCSEEECKVGQANQLDNHKCTQAKLRQLDQLWLFPTCSLVSVCLTQILHMPSTMYQSAKMINPVQKESLNLSARNQE